MEQKRARVIKDANTAVFGSEATLGAESGTAHDPAIELAFEEDRVREPSSLPDEMEEEAPKDNGVGNCNYSASQKQHYDLPQETAAADLERHRKTPQPARTTAQGARNTAAILNGDGPWAGQSRSLYIGPLPEDCSLRELCDAVRGDTGLEAVRLVTMKGRHCAFVDFIRRRGAERFVRRVLEGPGRGRLLLRRGNDVNTPDARVGWAKESAMQPGVARAIANGATRNVFISGVPPAESDDALAHAFAAFCHENGLAPPPSTLETAAEITDPTHPWALFLFHEMEPLGGTVDLIKIVPSRRIAFVHFASVAQAMRTASELPQRPAFRGKRISFGRDRCGERLEEQSDTPTAAVDSSSIPNPATFPAVSAAPSPARTVYIGNCGHDATIEDICDLIHTGQLQAVRVNRDRGCAFVTFVDPEAAQRFLLWAQEGQLTLRNGHVVRVDWARDTPTGSTPRLPLAVAQALQRGYTRTLYLGNIDPVQLPLQRLRSEFEAFGTLDTVQLLDARRCAFVHFAGIVEAGRAYEALKRGELRGFEQCRVGFGRDRCEPRQPSSSQTHNHSHSHSHSHSHGQSHPLPLPHPTPFGYFPLQTGTAPFYPPHWVYPPYIYHPDAQYDPVTNAEMDVNAMPSGHGNPSQSPASTNANTHYTKTYDDSTAAS